MNGLEMKYFVLTPTKDNIYGDASRDALLMYADQIAQVNPELAKDLREWVTKIVIGFYR